VGELARRSGLSVRTLHHWGDLGLLQPSHRSPAGHRLYTAADIGRLQLIVALRGLGLALTEVRDILADPRTTPLSVLNRRLERSRAHLALEQQLCSRLERTAAAFENGATDLPVEQTVHTIEVMTMIDRHYSAEQREHLARRRELLGDQRIQDTQANWALAPPHLRGRAGPGGAVGRHRPPRCVLVHHPGRTAAATEVNGRSVGTTAHEPPLCPQASPHG
jgi:DNA-binding transcriptional MerR regulator